MTYIDYLNTFNRWLESNPLPGNAQLLFFRLLNVFNGAGWPEYVRVDTLRLMLMSDSKSEKTARMARDKLIEAGFIAYRKGKKGVPNAYYLTIEQVKNTGEKITGNNYPQSYPESYPESSPENDRHIKSKSKIKNKNISTTTAEHTPVYDEGLGRVMTLFLDKVNATPPMTAIEELKGYTEDLGPDVVCHALDIALGEKKTSWSFIKAILQRYSRERLTSIEAVRRSEQEFEENKQKKSYVRKNIKVSDQKVDPNAATNEDMDRMKKALEKMRENGG